MASKKKSAPKNTRTIVVHQPAAAVARPRARTRVVQAAKRGVRRVGSSVAGAAAQQKNDLIAVGAAAALGYAEKPNESTGKPHFELPTFGGYDPAVLWGIGLGFVAPRIPGLKAYTRSARAAGIGLLCVGVNRSVARGSAKVSGEDD
jgi:hypothetical protein